jgi:two-component system, OmpR family, sensor histidine kinase TctE
LRLDRPYRLARSSRATRTAANSVTDDTSSGLGASAGLSSLTTNPPKLQRVQRSLFGEILDWMLAPLLVLWPMSLGLTWVVAQAIANGPFDRALADVARALARQSSEQAVLAIATDKAGDSAVVAERLARARAELQRTAEPLIHFDDSDGDTVYYQVLGPRGEMLAGDSLLTVPVTDAAEPNVMRFRDDMVGDELVRVAYIWLGRPTDESGAALVQVAETLGKRSRLTTEIIKGVILPQFVILPLAVLLVWFALVRGIRPLAELQQRIRRRQSTDLSPIDDSNVPDEVAPLVGAINDLLQRLDRTVATQRHFLADAAHQLKTPLAGLRTQAELAMRDLAAGQGEPAHHPARQQALHHSLQQIARSSERAAHMVNQLLAMARAEDTGEATRLQPVDLPALTREVVRDFVPLALERHIDLGYEGPEPADHAPEALSAEPGLETTAGTSTAPAPTPAPKLGLMAEPVLLGELVRNLVDNALRYTPAGGSVTVRVVPDSFSRQVLLQVEDTGPGIAPAEREAVFRPFYRALGTQVDGSGLGLAIVREIALRHGADITLGDATTAPTGALFTVRFAAQPLN